MQHNLRDPNRDRQHGRIYRVSYQGREPNKPEAIAGEPIEKLLDLLKHSEDRIRYRAPDSMIHFIKDHQGLAPRRPRGARDRSRGNLEDAASPRPYVCVK